MDCWAVPSCSGGGQGFLVGQGNGDVQIAELDGRRGRQERVLVGVPVGGGHRHEPRDGDLAAGVGREAMHDMQCADVLLRPSVS